MPVTSRRNREDFAEFEIVPRVLVDVSDVDTRTTVLGQPIAVPLLGAPMGLNGLVHHHGEAGIARAMHDAGTIHALAAMASYSIEEIAAPKAPGPTWLQMAASGATVVSSASWWSELAPPGSWRSWSPSTSRARRAATATDETASRCRRG